MRRS
ncbi:hypothetical protein DNTS_027539 [Danionella cerebrum]|jgi:hypothetical protein